MPSETDAIKAARKLYNWGRVESFRHGNRCEPGPNSVPGYPSSRKAKPEGSRAFVSPGFIPSIVTDHLDVEILIKRYRWEILRYPVSLLEEEDRLSRVLRWRFALEETFDGFKDETIDEMVRSSPAPRFSRLLATAYYDRMADGFVAFAKRNLAADENLDGR